MRRKPALSLILVLVILGGWLRVWRIGSQSLWFDEVFSRNVAVMSDIPTIARDGVAGDVHPPLYFMLLNVWTHFVGDSAVALRMLSALIALLALPAYYHLGRLLFDRRTGTIALLLGAISPFQIYYAQEARQYALSIMLAAWAAIGLIALIRGKRYGWPLYVLGAVGGLYTHYFTGLMLAAIHLWLIFYGPARRAWRRWLSADIIIALLFVPQLFQFTHQSAAVLSGFWIDRPNLGDPVTTLAFLMFSTTLPSILSEVAGITLVMAGLVIAGFDMLTRVPTRIRSYWILCIGTIITPLLFALIFSLLRSPIYLQKSFGLLSPFLLMALASGVAYVRPPSLGAIRSIGLIGLMIFGTVSHALTPDIRKPPFQQIAADLMADPDSATTPILYLHDSAYLPLSYYAPTLTGLAYIVDLQNRSWLFPETWRIFGVKRQSRDEIQRWVAEYHGKLRVILTANAEASEQVTLKMLLDRNCLYQMHDYPPAVSVYYFVCP